MGDIKEYRERVPVRAEVVEENGNVFTSGGVYYANAGDYLVHNANGVSLFTREAFEGSYEEISQEESEARKFTPDGKTVEMVLEFLKANPQELTRVKQLERDGGSRKGILEYEI